MNTQNTQEAFKKLLEYNIGEDTKTYLNSKMSSHDAKETIYYDTINADSSSDIMKQVVGKGGHYFKLTTLNFNVEFIWYDKIKNKIEFWGYAKDDIENAKQLIAMRIKLIHNRMNAATMQDTS